MKKLFYFVIITGIVYVSAVFVSEIPRKAAFQVQANVARIAEIIILNNMCTPETVFSADADKEFCSKDPIFKVSESVEVDLTTMKGLYYKDGKLLRIFNILSKAPQGKWYQTPTGFYRIGVKKERHQSSLFPVYMPYSVQYYEDFFIHAVPFYTATDERVPPSFTGGCIRLGDDDAKFMFDALSAGDRITVYETFKDFKLNPEFAFPVDPDKVWIRQTFNNPIRFFWGMAAEDKKNEYYHHAGVDIAGWGFENLPVYSVYGGIVVIADKTFSRDHGFGNTVLIQYDLPDGQTVYGQYIHLHEIDAKVQKGVRVAKGQQIGTMGSSGYGCSEYWKIGGDGCAVKSDPDNHLHFEIKTGPTLLNPKGGDEACYNSSKKIYGPCYGYPPSKPEDYGYMDPIEFLRAR